MNYQYHASTSHRVSGSATRTGRCESNTGCARLALKAYGYKWCFTHGQWEMYGRKPPTVATRRPSKAEIKAMLGLANGQHKAVSTRCEALKTVERWQRENGEGLTLADYCYMVDVPKATGHKHLSRSVSAGLLERYGTRPRRHRLSEQGREAFRVLSEGGVL